MTRASQHDDESVDEFNAEEAWRALQQHLTPVELELVHRMFSRHTDRAEALVATRRGQSLSGPEFARFMLEIAKRIEREGGASS